MSDGLSQQATTAPVGGSSGGGGPNPTDAFSLGVKVADSNTAPTDSASFLLRLSQADSNLAPSDALSLNIKGLGDTNPAPTDGVSVTVRVWLSASANTRNFTNPANANGQNDAAVAVGQSVALDATNPNSILTSALGASIGTFTFTSAVYRGWFKSVNTLITSTGSVVIQSNSALFADVVMFSNSALNATVDNLNGGFSFDLVAAGINTLAKLQSMQVIHQTVDAAAGVAPHVMTVDAGACDLTGVF